jgi:serine/threonine protein kinase
MADTLETVQAAIGDNYRLIRAIGRGGMATVYLAEDVKHHRKVAVKVLKPELAEALGGDRFLQEIEIAAGLTHPHILPLHDSCDVEGCLHYVMPFVDGESLRGLMNRSGALEPARALHLVQEVASALTYAHRQGVVHRDIKPENILLSEGHAVVADFGIAKAISTAGGVHLTRTGFPVGTPGYMSPEQAVGRTDLDETTDVYSLACVFYEMVIGETPEMWPTEEAMRLGRFIDASPQHRKLLDRLPGSAEQVLVKALSLKPSNRFSSPNAFAEALVASFGTKPQFRHTQAKEIVKRAADIQLENPTQEGALSLGGVQQIAAEVGIPPQYVEQAARSLDRPTASPTHSRFLGAPTVIQFERVVNGEVPESEYPELVEEIRATFGTTGEINTLGQSLAWRTPGQGTRQASVTIIPRAGRTRIRVRERLTNLAGGLFGGIMGGVGGSSIGAAFAIAFGAGIPLLGIGVAAVAVSGSYGLARLIYTANARVKSTELSDLADRLAQYVEDVVTTPG